MTFSKHNWKWVPSQLRIESYKVFYNHRILGNFDEKVKGGIDVGSANSCFQSPMNSQNLRFI